MTVALARPEATLDSRYTASDGWVYMTGTQALVRLPIQQRLRDAAAGLNTGGYISGYRGSPLGRYDIELWRAAPQLKQHNIVFRPGLNEDLAATAIWGAQQVNNFPGATVDGVFGIWYGKGPGVDRSADALRHANFTGSSPKGGALALAGDDHGAKSSTAVNFSDTLFIAVGMPVIYPSNTQELLDFGLHGIAMSRFSGCWVGMKVVTDVAEGGGTVYVGPDLPEIVFPQRPSAPPHGVWARTLDAAVAQEERLYQHKLPAALAYARANGLNRIIDDSAGARIGVVAAGKAWQDLLQTLGNLGLDDDGAALGLRLLKVGMVWPLDPVIVRDFARGLDLIIVIEEKRPLLEDQIRSILYGDSKAPRIVGKYFDGQAFDPSPGALAIPNFGEITPELIAGVLAKAISRHDPNCALSAPEAPGAMLSNRPAPMRSPGFCAGCPHNRSTPVPEGSRALAGIGCHWMATLVNPQQTTTASHMGGEGVMWLGQEPFTKQDHVFANIGDGTYAHSGSLAIRQALAANVPITYKILFNGFVSMTGGQPIEGGMTPVQILEELAAEGVKKMTLVADDPERYAGVPLPHGVSLRHRDTMDETQREFREFKGVSVILYEQPCATERRRLRKRGKWADPAKRTFINPQVCEGCGDCGRVSNCMRSSPWKRFGARAPPPPPPPPPPTPSPPPPRDPSALAANVPITYKILFNASLIPHSRSRRHDPFRSSRACRGGVKKMTLVADDPERYAGVPLPHGVSLRHRDTMDETQREFREFKGVSVILYEQPCATERRRLRKRGKWADPAKRTFINPQVCEGCGDCGRVSNCMAIEPLETEFGRKRRINQSSCNKDFSCVEGFCPSFVTVHGGRLRKPEATAPLGQYLPPVPEPILPEIHERFSLLVAGIGGSGVVTISQTVAVAAYLDGLFSSNLDLTGLSQKYGAVTAHVRIAHEPGALHATRIAAGEADALIGCDLIVAAGDELISKLKRGKTGAVISADLTPTADFARNPNWSVDADELIERLKNALGDKALIVDAQRLSASLMGDPIASNMFMLGAAWQRGLVPIRREAIDRAIELNGVAIDANKQAFEWGRRAGHDPMSIETLVGA